MTLAHDADLAQRRAADSGRSVWVSASAGSGKTKVLTDRVLNLLLTGAAPERLLCLTFTKAAAAEMSNRVNERLSAWAVASDAALREDIRNLAGTAPDDETCKAARRLFARVLDTPGGMRILTIHAFCQSILRRFPLEADIIPNFEIMDDRSAAELRIEARNTILAVARAAPESALAQALAIMTARVEEFGFAALLNELQRERGRLQEAFARAGGVDAYIAALWRSLDLAPGTGLREHLLAACGEDVFDGEALRAACRQLLASDKSTDRENGAAMATWLAAAPVERAAEWGSYLSIFLTDKFQIRARLATASVVKGHPGILSVLQTEAERVDTVRLRGAGIAAAEASAALARVADAFLGRYALEKRQRGLLDYDDLILATRALLTRPGIEPWVLFKLDGGIDHILIDEAQDTSPDQWQVIEALAAEFFTGEGARPNSRTIFAVGDPKQSIYSFQGAEPRRFLEIGQKFRDQATQIGRDFDTVPLAVSFRSTQPVLTVVDQVFARAPASEGVVFDAVPVQHFAFRDQAPGRVELWPLLAPRDEDPPLPWVHADEQKFAAAPRAQLAERIAATIQRWIDEREYLPARHRPIRAGDILVLVRRRDAFVRDLIRALKTREIPVAGADRIVLSEQLAVMDLMALGRFLLLPEDDLTLAALLKSPLFNVDEEQLFTLCHERGGETLWSRLRRSADLGPGIAAAAETLKALLARADFVSPHALFAEVLSARGGRRRLIGRLGPEAADAIDEFLNQSLAYERVHVPSLQGFLSWLEQNDSDLKRDLDQGDRDEVRIMTVHGSKGLQAPIVFLPDTVTVPSKLSALLWSDAGFLLWAPGDGRAAPAAVAARRRAIEARDREYRRLLYVAMTRAQDRLYICGWHGRRTPAADNWHELVVTAMQQMPGVRFLEPEPAGDTDATPILVYTTETPPTEPHSGRETRFPASPVVALPEFVARPPAREPLPPRPLAALRPAAGEPPSRSPLLPAEDERRYKRGTIIHRLLQTLPDLPDRERAAAARRYLGRPALGLDPSEQQAVLDETLTVLDRPEFTDLFGPDSRAEVPVVGLLDDHALSGRIDRLVVTEREVLIIDYKTNRPPAHDVATVPAAYLGQLNAYRRALAAVYPDKTIRTFLLWTVGPFILEVPAGV